MRAVFFAILFLAVCSVQAQDASTIIHHATIAKNNGEYKVALNSYESAIDIALSCRDTISAINALQEIVSVGISLKNPELSLSAKRRIIDLHEANLNYDDFDRLFDYGDIMVYLAKLGREEATDLMPKFRQYAQAIKGEYFIHGFYFMQLGLTFQNLGHWEKAVSSYKQSLDAYSKSSSTYAKEFGYKTKGLYASALYNVGNKADAYKEYKNWAAITDSLYGHRHANFAEALMYQGNIEAYLGDINLGAKNYSEALDIAIELARQDLQMLPSSQRKKYWDDLNDIMFNFIPFAVEAGFNEDEFTSKAYESLMFSK